MKAALLSTRPRQAAWLLLGLSLALLPSLAPIFWPKSDLGLISVFLHLTGLALLPCVFGLTPRRLLQCLWPIVILVPVAMSCYLSTQCKPSEWFFLVMQETNSAEMSNFGLQITSGLVGFIVLAAIYYLTLRQLVPGEKLHYLYRAIALLFILGFPLLKTARIGPEAAYKDEQWRVVENYPVNIFAAMYKAVQINRSLNHRGDLSQDLAVTSNAPALPPGQREIHLMVIGETARASAFQINGYERETTPELMRLPVLSFNNVTSPAPITSVAVPILLTPSSARSANDVATMPSVMSVYKKAGFKVYWISTQPKHGFHDTRCSMFSRDADEAQFLSGKWDPGGFLVSQALDGEMLPAVDQFLARNDPKVLLVLHTMGCHMTYSDRYPAEFNHWQADPKRCEIGKDKKVTFDTLTPERAEHLRNAYDNSLLYTDHVLAQLITRLDQTNTLATLYYVSDHGENGGDALVMPFGHGVLTRDALSVPLIVWTSPEYQAWCPEKAHALQAHLNEPISADSSFHTMLDLAGLISPQFHAEKSLANPAFTLTERVVVGLDGIVANYDKDIAPRDTRRNGWHPIGITATAASIMR
jgi:glucan phosphoethanolaminetransferase (alkaline phosphatase superfamily)